MPRFNLTHLVVLLGTAGVFAIPALGQVTATETAAVREHVNKGNYHMARRQFDQAIEEYEAALDVDPGSMVAKENLVLVHNNWGIALFGQRKWDEARAQWEKALQMNPYDRNAKQNLLVLKTTLARLGPPKPPPAPIEKPEKPGAEKKETPETKAAEKEEPSPSGGVVLLNKQPAAAKTAEPEASPSGAVIMLNNSGAKQSAPPPPAPETPAQPPETTSTPVQIMNSPYSFVEETRPAKPGEVSSPYVMPTNLPTPAKPKPYVAPPPPATKPSEDPWNTPIPTQTTAPAATNTESDNGANLEDQLAAIEIKVNGRKQKSMPLLKRIEKLENAISGQTKSGSLQERIEALRKSCGL